LPGRADPLDRFDPGADAIASDPAAYWHRVTLGAERLPAPGGGVAIWRHAEVEALLKHPTVPAKCPSRALRPFPPGPFREHNAATMAFLDPPEHGPVRRSFARAFSPTVLSALVPQLEETSAELLGALHGEVDLVAAYAERLPVLAIASILGLDPSSEELMRGAAEAVVAGLEPGASAATLRSADAAVERLIALVRPPMTAPPSGTLFARLQESPEAEGLDPAHRLHNAIFLLNAGHETTTRLIAGLAVALLGNPALAEAAAADGAVAAAVVEEVLRLDPPLHFVPRFLAEPWKDLAAGTIVFCLLAAANRDPAIFHRPSYLDPSRLNSARHLSFAAGRHLCLGATLARIEGRIACRHLARLAPRLATHRGAARTSGRMFQGWRYLPVSIS
jgi:cytochrome P450